MKNHLKRIATPPSWHLNRKERTFTVRPNSGTHPLKWGVSLGAILRDMLHLAVTMREIRKVLYAQEVLVDGVRRHDHRFMVGLFDVLSIPTLKKHYRIILDQKGRITVHEVPVSESTLKLCKVVRKVMAPGGKIQLGFNDGKTIISNQKINVGDSVMLSLPALSVKKVLPLHPEVVVFLMGGKRSGSIGTLKEIKNEEAVYREGEKEVGTSKKYLFVVGEQEPEITITSSSL